MDYHKIHDALINRARHRTEKLNNILYHLHHVFPMHEGGLVDGETVLLTIKEHYVVHHLRYKITKTLGNKMAWMFLKGLPLDILTINSEAGKIGGVYTRDNKLGIFSPDYDISKQSKLNWSSGLMSHIDFTEISKVGGALEESGTRSGICGKEWRENNKEFVLENSSKGGKIGGKIGGKVVGDMLWWNNGTVNKKAIEQPEGFAKGMLMSEKKKAQLDRMRLETSNIKVECIHCGFICAKGHHARYHGDNCKNNKNKKG